ncbi:hypothetical protein [Methylocella sp. CPCC 101449]|uniref:hypothetical protein n=1 Tax=Methylocella sp. CPCC 101449 TaxID=2987531 RepID=UPI00288E4C91|nr:hypothetical protein [Methylocella sp. CPCC 101449]MDT2022186.1 hypothetical protein [Methylocella sp. CPCC 101449]
MSRSIKSTDQTGRFWFGLYIATMIAIGILFGLLWYMSPFALGFAQWPADPLKKRWAMLLYQASFYAGIPMLLLAPLVAMGLNAKGFRRTAIVLPLASLLVFSASAMLVLSLLNPA